MLIKNILMVLIIKTKKYLMVLITTSKKCFFMGCGLNVQNARIWSKMNLANGAWYLDHWELKVTFDPKSGGTSLTPLEQEETSAMEVKEKKKKMMKRETNNAHQYLIWKTRKVKLGITIREKIFTWNGFYRFVCAQWACPSAVAAAAAAATTVY